MEKIGEMITSESIRIIESEKIFFNQLKVKRNGKEIFTIIGYEYSEENLKHTGYAEDVANYLNGYFGNRMKISTSKYCGECERDFLSGEIVHYAWIENRSFCSSCKEKLNIKDWEERIISED